MSRSSRPRPPPTSAAQARARIYAVLGPPCRASEVSLDGRAVGRIRLQALSPPSVPLLRMHPVDYSSPNRPNLCPLSPSWEQPRGAEGSNSAPSLTRDLWHYWPASGSFNLEMYE